MHGELDDVKVDAMLLERVLDEHEDAGLQVTFGVKELFQSIDRKLDDRVTKADFSRLERDVTDLKSKVQSNEIRWARVMGGVGVLGVLTGGAGAALAKALGLG